MAKKDTPMCTTCGTQIIVKHISTDCRRCGDERKENNLPQQYLYEIQTEETNRVIIS